MINTANHGKKIIMYKKQSFHIWKNLPCCIPARRFLWLKPVRRYEHFLHGLSACPIIMILFYSQKPNSYTVPYIFDYFYFFLFYGLPTMPLSLTEKTVIPKTRFCCERDFWPHCLLWLKSADNVPECSKTSLFREFDQ